MGNYSLVIVLFFSVLFIFWDRKKNLTENIFYLFGNIKQEFEDKPLSAIGIIIAGFLTYQANELVINQDIFNREISQTQTTLASEQNTLTKNLTKEQNRIMEIQSNISQAYTLRSLFISEWNNITKQIELVLKKPIKRNELDLNDLEEYTDDKGITILVDNISNFIDKKGNIVLSNELSEYKLSGKKVYSNKLGEVFKENKKYILSDTLTNEIKYQLDILSAYKPYNLSTNKLEADFSSPEKSRIISYLSDREIDLSFLRGVNLEYIKLPHRKVKFKSNKNTSLYTVTIEGTKIKATELQDINFNGSDLSFTSFSNSDLSFSKFTNTNIKAVSFNDCNLIRVNFSEADLEDSYFNNSNLFKANFKKANLNRVTFDNSNIRGCDFSNTNLLEARSLKGTKFDSNTKLPFSKDKAIELGMIFVKS